METTERLKRILGDTLQLGTRAGTLTSESRLLGALPEFDSMAVVTVLTLVEEEFDISINDDEVSAATFETLGTLAAFVSRKTGDR